MEALEFDNKVIIEQLLMLATWMDVGGDALSFFFYFIEYIFEIFWDLSVISVKLYIVVL